MCGIKMATEGLPLVRRERGADRGILAGADFLSVFMESSLRRAYRETTTSLPETSPPPTTFNTGFEDLGQTDPTPYIRTSRSASNLLTTVAQLNTERHLYDTTLSALETSDSSLNDRVVVEVRVSSSVGRTLINKQVGQDLHEDSIEDTTIRESATHPTIYSPTEVVDHNFLPSEEPDSIVAEANKSEFSVEESEPITSNSEHAFSKSYPSGHPVHHSVIYHNNPRDPGHARSVSYSTVIQSLPHENTEKASPHDRHERHYETSQHSFNNNYENHESKINNNETFKTLETSGSMAETKNYLVTSTPILNSQQKQKNWETPEQNYEEQSSTVKNALTTERNWEMAEKRYAPLAHQVRQRVYGRPEQNYEVDEAVSVMSNGRIHGVQPSQPPLTVNQDAKNEDLSKKDKDDNQKVGYVVEGRNYRKYRVEERTADGFIVGEYGVVSHDDGSLRGVRYTADGTINPRLIYDALMKFLSL